MGLTKEAVIKNIERYIRRSDSHPRLVNVNNPEDAESICKYFSIGKNQVKSVSDFSRTDENLSEDELYNFIGNAEGNVFLTGFTSYYRFFGEKKLQDFINRMAGMSVSRPHLVVICYQCEKYLMKTEKRYQQFIYMVDGQKTEIPQMIFAPKDIPATGREPVVEGIQDIAAYVECESSSKIFVHTEKRKSSYPYSLYTIREISNSYEVLCNIDISTRQLKEEYGTEQEWDNILPKISRSGSWMKYIKEIFGTTTNLELVIGNWTAFDSGKKWLYFIALKLYGAKNSWCLSQTIDNVDSSALFVRGIYRSILSLAHNSNDFWDHYEERKKIIQLLGNPDVEVTDYCAMAKSKGENILYYLTDASRREQNMIFEGLAAYSEKIGRNKVLEILGYIYPDLYAYLQPYRFKIPLLDDYFQGYKYQKVVNKIFPEFLSVVEEQAEKREFNLLLPARSEKLDDIEKKGTVVYFMDAMGVEYLSYIMKQCQLKCLMAYVALCHCELPSITSFNKEFVDVFEAGGADFIPDKNGIKSLDDLKHHGVEEFDFTNNSFPTYMSIEFEIISQTIEKISTKLERGEYKRAVMISDHGASRLSVLSQKENKWGSESNAEHSGRCCPVSEIDEKPSCAIEENEYWVLANYDRFKGGRKANIEVHGGATLEEVVVPIIEIIYSPKEIEIQLLDKNIKFSRRKKNAAIRIFSKTKLDSLSIRIMGLSKEYEGQSSDGQNFMIVLPDLKKSGKYTTDVYYNGGNRLKSGLEFTAENSDFGERNLL